MLFCLPVPVVNNVIFSLHLIRPSVLFVRHKSSASSKRWLQRQKNDYYSRNAKHENLKSRAAFKLLQIDQKYKIFRSPYGKPLNVVDLGAAPGAWNQVALERCPANSKILGVDILPYQPPRGVSSMQANILSKRTHEQIRDFYRLSNREHQLDSLKDVEIKTDAGETIIVKENSMVQTEHELLEEEDLSTSPLPVNGQDILTSHWPLDVVLSDMYVPIIQISGFGNSTTNNPYYRMANTSGLAVRDHEMSMDLCDAALIVAIDLLKKGGSLVIKFFTGERDEYLEKRLKMVFHKVNRFKPDASRSESKECYFVCLDKRNDYVDKVEVFTKA
ncbi:DEKNAAC103997 [Brettanomyces naardenensis]|uniref:rRNA methyltransferase 2, mitochondrial n=1 Tax=Brettanomyces naardenensis TaxID=13370 RepID=A0A448YQC2_BRENA|nr:DEKNAAC103997 [Brettanomyces naardenensis]